VVELTPLSEDEDEFKAVNDCEICVLLAVFLFSIRDVSESEEKESSELKSEVIKEY